MTYACVTLVCIVAFVYLVSGRQERIVLDQIKQGLHASAVYLRAYARQGFTDGLTKEQDFAIHKLAQENGHQILLIRNDGTVELDTRGRLTPRIESKLLDYPEIKAAERHGQGEYEPEEITRYSTMHYAIRIGAPGQPVGYVRISKSLDDARQQMITITSITWMIATGMTIVMLGITYFVVARIIQPLDRLTIAAKAMTAGELHQKVKLTSNDELTTLADAFNSMSQELTNRVAELQKQGRQLRASSEQLSTILGGMIEGVVAIDAGERILFANHSAFELLEFESQRVVGKRIWEAIRNSTVQQVVRDVLSGQQTVRSEIEIHRTHSVVELIASRLPGEPCPGLVLVLHDVSELRRLENMRREFVSNVSHELKTPLTAIQTCAETLLDGAIDEPGVNRSFLRQIDEHSDRLHELIQDMLRLAKIESTQDVFDVIEVSVNDIIHKTVEQYRHIADGAAVTLVIEPSPTTLTIFADAEGLRTIVGNLIRNAVSHSPSGQVVTVRYTREGDNVRISVTDRGPGIALKHQARIFERFYRIDAGRSRDQGGTGLGLAIVKHLVQLFHGRIEVLSEEGKGATFTATFPLAQTFSSAGSARLLTPIVQTTEVESN